MRGLPARIVSALPLLECLDLACNQLTALPPELGRLSALRGLSLDNNRLAALPPEFGRLTALTLLIPDDNPLTYPPAEFVDQGAEAVVSFLGKVLADGKPFHEAKLVLVGDPSHGKTALRSWLEFGVFREPPESTRGGEVAFRDLIVRGEAKGRVNIWDFGGQDRYRPAQLPLFTPGALYLVLCDKRSNIAEAGLPEWLRLIQLRAGRQARVLLVFTRMGAHDGIPSLAALPNDLRALIKDGDIFGIDSPSGHRVEALLARVWDEVGKRPGFEDKWPASYLAARDAVLALRTNTLSANDGNYISYSRYLEVCRPHGVEGLDARVLATALSLQGRLDYKGWEVDVDQIVVLNPEWLLKAIAYVLDDDALANTQGGILHIRDLDRVWRNHNRPAADNPIRFEEHLWPHLLKLMAEHELIYRLTEREWLVPQKVTDRPLNPVPWTQTSDPIRMDCRLNYPISGLMAVLTVKHNYKYVDRSLFWQRGAFLRHPNTHAEALVTVDGEQTVHFEARGPRADALMQDLQDTFVRLVESRWPGTAQDEEPPYQFTVPCLTPGCRGHYSLNVLRAELAAKKSDDAACAGSTPHRHKLLRLLYGIEPTAAEDASRKMRNLHLTYGKPPRLIEISDAPPETIAGRLKKRVKIQVYSELSETPVSGASDMVAVDTKWWEATKKWGPYVAGEMFKAGMKMAFPDGTVGLPDMPEARDDQCPDDANHQVFDLPKGLLIIPIGQHLPQPVADKLIAIANKGDMRQTELSDGLWVWVSASEADRNDTSKPKE